MEQNEIEIYGLTCEPLSIYQGKIVSFVEIWVFVGYGKPRFICLHYTDQKSFGFFLFIS